jgi:hypothetical protein
MKRDKAFDIIKYLVENGYTYDKEHVDVTAFIKRQFNNEGRPAGAVLHSLYHANMIDGHDIENVIRSLQNMGNPVDSHKIMLRARLAAVESVNRAKDNSQIILLTRAGIITTLLVFVFSPLYERCSGPLLPTSKAKEQQAPVAGENPDTLRLTPSP